jgi:hypothetical protein
LSSEDAESVTLSSIDETSVDGDMILMNRVISDEDLERILDRSRGAFEKKVSSSKSGSNENGNDGNEGDGEDDTAKFREVDAVRDEGNDLLTNMA